MNLTSLVTDSIWAGLFAGAMSIVFSAPYSALFLSSCGGFVGRLVRDMLLQWGAGANVATLVAAAMVVMVAALRRPGMSPVITVSGILPLGAAGAFSRAIVDFLQISSLTEQKASAVALSLVWNISVVFTTTAAIGAGISVAVYAVRLFAWKKRTR
jgi:uncharacterized membrane protein YjjB (DUF3815 family)